MTYDKKFATPSFRNALAEVLNGGKKQDEVVEKQEVEETVELAEDDNLEELTEEELLTVMEEELGPHIAYLLDEGFSEEEVENIMVEMLSAEDEEELVEKKKEKKEKKEKDDEDEDDEDEDKD